MSKLSGSVAVVTGASRGIGFAVAQRLVSEGARVCITGRNDEALQNAVKELGGEEAALGVAGRGDDAEHRAAVFETVRNSFGAPSILVNNIGINPAYGPLMDVEPGAARKMLDVNILGTLAWTQEAVKAGLGESEKGAVVNVSSVSGLRASPGIAFYGVTKAAIIHLTEELSVELAPEIRVNAVAPGVVKTRFATVLYEGREGEVAGAYPLKRLGVPEDISGAVSFLCSPDAAWITGHTIVIDGGITQTGTFR
jgi:NAD(P)-dependent dehydrogenase (short-subunit alcohol dehydrogenase family)